MKSKLPKSVKIVEVGPRDGLQNEKAPVATQDKIRFINQLGAAGLKYIEASSFVRAEAVPQLNDAEAVFAGIERKPNVVYSALTPNEHGLQRALDAGADEIAVFAAASETFSQKNINASIGQSLERFKPVITRANQHGLKTRGYVSCVLGCPYEGAIAVAKVVQISRQLHDMGCYEISLGDTIGVGTPIQARKMVEAVSREIPIEALAVHFHDTYGMALANLFACLEIGISVIDASTGGLGGCPYAPGASGNVATEDVVYMLEGLGIATGIDLNALADSARSIFRVMGRTLPSRLTLHHSDSHEK